MKLSINEILLSTRALSQLSNQQLPIAPAFIIAENLRLLNVINELFEKQRDKICEKYGTKTEDETGYHIPQDKVAAFNKEISKATAEKMDTDLKQIEIASLGDDIKVSPNDLVHLRWLFSDYNDAEAPADAAGDTP